MLVVSSARTYGKKCTFRGHVLGHTAQSLEDYGRMKRSPSQDVQNTQSTIASIAKGHRERFGPDPRTSESSAW